MAKKKTFIEQLDSDNPALQFISTPSTMREAPAEVPEKAPEGYKRDPKYIEIKSRRLQLVLQPSLYEKVKRGAKAADLSVNEYCHRILEEATREE